MEIKQFYTLKHFGVWERGKKYFYTVKHDNENQS